jgi:hypothetical protein
METLNKYFDNASSKLLEIRYRIRKVGVRNFCISLTKIWTKWCNGRHAFETLPNPHLCPERG